MIVNVISLVIQNIISKNQSLIKRNLIEIETEIILWEQKSFPAIEINKREEERKDV